MATVVVGAINWDITMFVDRFPRRGEEVVVRTITHAPGGKGGNAAVASARLLGPNQTAIIGAIGNDWIATEHVAIFKKEGVDTSGLKHNDSIQSGQAYILVDKTGENQIHTHFGANATILPEDFNDEIRLNLLESANLISIMDPPFETSLKLAKDAKRKGKIVAWDPGVKSRMGFDAAKALLPYTDYFLANESEVRFLVGVSKRDAAIRKLRGVNPKLTVVMKLGAKGAIMYTGKKRIVSPGFDMKATGLRVVNSVGCGDAFMGAFAAALTEGRSEAEALRWGNCAAGLKTTRAETRGSPDRATLLKYLG